MLHEDCGGFPSDEEDCIGTHDASGSDWSGAGRTGWTHMATVQSRANARDRFHHPIGRCDEMAGKLVLVVDGERMIAMLLTRLAESCGVRAEVAHDGEQALEMLRAHKPDLVLLDLIMPIMSGEEVLAIMETDPNLRDVPVIVISTWDGAIEGLEREVPRVRKPFDPAEVQRLIRQTLHIDGQAA